MASEGNIGTGVVDVPEGAVVGDRYRLGRALGSGGMSSVFLAEDLKRPGRPRVVKVMARFLVRDERSRARFEQEALIGRALKHPNIVDVLAGGVDTALQAPWIAMERLEGCTLEGAVAARGPLPPGEVRSLFADFGAAVSAAHLAGVVHRDLKPDNVFLHEVPSRSLPYTVKVLDFGIAKVRKDVNELNSQVMGTPLWMAPEQLAPGTPIAPCTDVWAFGLVAFYALTGKPYWRVANEPAMNLPKLFGEIMADEMTPPSQRAKELGARVVLPPAFDAWFLRCVARDPAARFPTVGDATGALERALPAAAEPDRSSFGVEPTHVAPRPVAAAIAPVAGPPASDVARHDDAPVELPMSSPPWRMLLLLGIALTGAVSLFGWLASR